MDAVCLATARGGGEPADRAFRRAVAGQQPGDDLGVHRRTAARDPGHRVGELGSVEYPVLEQVTDRARAVGEQLAGVELLDVLGDDKDGQARDLGAGRERRPEPLVGERRRQPHVDDGDVAAAPPDRGEEVLAVVGARRALEAVGLKEPDQPLAQEEQVFRYDNAHGTSSVTTVGPPTGLDTARTPSNAASLRSVPRRPVPRAGSAPPPPSSLTLIRSAPASWRRSTSAASTPACLATLASSSLTAEEAARPPGAGTTAGT